VEKLLAALSAPGGRAAISAIDGMGGLGKTTLAVHVAHRLTERYPDGQIVVDMAGTSTVPLLPAQAMARVIRAFEPMAQLPEAEAELAPLYLSLLRGKRVLLILDNALDGDQVAPLLPPENCALIVTARRRIAVAGLARVDLDLLAPGEAAGLLRSIVGDGRATEAELSRIAELCGLLPLALRIAGMFLADSPHWSAAEFIAALADERKRIGRLRMEGRAALDVAASLAQLATPRANSLPSTFAMLTTSISANGLSTRRTPVESKLALPRVIARCAPVSTTTRPRTPAA
jgi:hypothetical protein